MNHDSKCIHYIFARLYLNFFRFIRPVVVNENQHSIIYKIENMKLSLLQRVDTFEAKDAEFLNVDEDLYLLFAHR